MTEATQEMARVRHQRDRYKKELNNNSAHQRVVDLRMRTMDEDCRELRQENERLSKLIVQATTSLDNFRETLNNPTPDDLPVPPAPWSLGLASPIATPTARFADK